MNPSINEEMRAIDIDLHDAQRVAETALEELFPGGCEVFVRDRRGGFVMRVESCECRCGSLTVFGVNIETGKKRWFYPGCDEIGWVKPPAGEAA